MAKLLANLSSRVGFRPPSRASIEQSGTGSNHSSHNPTISGTTSGTTEDKGDINTATCYRFPESSAVHVNGDPLPRLVSQVRVGEKVLAVNFEQGGMLTWVTVVRSSPIKNMETQSLFSLSMNGTDVSLLPEQSILIVNQKGHVVGKMARRLQFLKDSFLAFSYEGARKTIPIRQMHLVKSNVDFYDFEFSSPNHAVLLSPSATAEHSIAVFRGEAPKVVKGMKYPIFDVSVKNTFISAEPPAADNNDDAPVKLVRSYSDTCLAAAEAALLGCPGSDDVFDVTASIFCSSSQSPKSESDATSGRLTSDFSSVSNGSNPSNVSVVRVGSLSRGGHFVALSEVASLPFDKSGQRLTEASILHEDGKKSKCRTCAFHNAFAIRQGKSCKYGALCDFCHLDNRYNHRRA